MAVWLLPGQGAQAPGMGAGIVQSAAARTVFDVASDVLGLDMRHLAVEADREQVDEPYRAQALTAAVSIACGRALMERGIRPDALIGFSLGQIGALALSGMLSLEDTFGLLKVRASSMANACRQHRGAMLALAGCSLEQAQDYVDKAAQGDVLVVANHNCPGQKVVSGDADAIERCERLVAEAGGRCVRLNTAGAFHSPLMHDAAEEVAAACGGLTFAEPSFPIICNTDARTMVAEQAGIRLAKQVESPVLFEESVCSLLDSGHHAFAEVGYGKVLSGLMRRIDKSAECVRVATEEQAAEYAGRGAA